MAFAVGQLAVFQGATTPATLRVAMRAGRRAYLNGYVRSEQRRKTANWPRPGGSGMKMGRRLRCSSVTYRFRYAPLLLPVRLGPPCRRPILIATKAMLFMGQDTRLGVISALFRIGQLLKRGRLPKEGPIRVTSGATLLRDVLGLWPASQPPCLRRSPPWLSMREMV
jgi:hypothetical protein